MNKIDYEDVIYGVLITRRSCGFKELYYLVHQVQKTTEATFSKYLNRLVNKGLVIREVPKTKKNKRAVYFIEPEIKTRVIHLTKILQDNDEKLKEELQMLEAYIVLLKDLPTKYLDNTKKTTILFSRMVISISIIYKILSFLEFIQISGMIPEINQKRVSSMFKHKACRLSELLDSIKKISPLYHYNLCMYIADNGLMNSGSNG